MGESGELGTHDTRRERYKQATVHVTRATLAQQCALYIYTPMQCSRVRLRVFGNVDVQVILLPSCTISTYRRDGYKVEFVELYYVPTLQSVAGIQKSGDLSVGTVSF